MAHKLAAVGLLLGILAIAVALVVVMQRWEESTHYHYLPLEQIK